MHLSNKGREILSHSHGTIVNDCVLNLEVITEMERGWQKSSAMQRLIDLMSQERTQSVSNVRVTLVSLG